MLVQTGLHDCRAEKKTRYLMLSIGNREIIARSRKRVWNMQREQALRKEQKNRKEDQKGGLPLQKGRQREKKIKLN